MSHVPEVDLHIYQGEDWEAELALSGDDAPEDEAELATWAATMELRKKNQAQTLLARIEMDDGITVLAGASVPTLKMIFPKEVTRALPSGIHLTDMFLTPDGGATFPVFSGKVEVTRRVTIEES